MNMQSPIPPRPETPRNVLDSPLKPCCFEPMTGFYRDGYCHMDPRDRGEHTVCAQMTDAFLAFSQSRGNDLSTPRPEWNFPGLKEGDRWCLCALRWIEAYQHGMAPQLVLESCHESLLHKVPLEILRDYAVAASH